MLKVKKITLNGFRGILRSQELNLCVSGENAPKSLVLYGPNSSGKTSFVDGIEWFLSADNKIEWLKRQDAEEKAYPHQALNPKKSECFVQLEFSDAGKKLGTVRKTYNFNKITQPTLKDKADFDLLHTAYIIKPYLRYLEVIDFVYNRTGLEKYQKLASWMGFEKELAFQEKIALKILPEIKNKKDELQSNIKLLEQQLRQLLGGREVSEKDLLAVANAILADHQQTGKPNIKSLFEYIPEFSKRRIVTAAGQNVDTLTRAETTINLFEPDSSLPDALEQTRLKIELFKQEKSVTEQLDIIGLYDKALEVLVRKEDESTKCPVCGTEWQRDELVKHIKEELVLLNKVKVDKESIVSAITGHKTAIQKEKEAVKTLTTTYERIQKLVNDISYEKSTKYLKAISENDNGWLSNPFTATLTSSVSAETQQQVTTEKASLLKRIAIEKAKIQPSKEDVKLSGDIEKLNQIMAKWGEIEEAKLEDSYTNEQIDSFIAICNNLIAHIQENVKSRFNEISNRIATYFGILRSDKDIDDIKIVLNEGKGKAAGRSAEIQLNYYDVTVKPAYKVLSESLLNSLGLAVYFACIKQFNDECKFIVLDDIMNSLDIEKRDTLLDLIQQEFGDYQIILFTHDLYWYQKIIRRFPSWIPKKIKGWSYESGASIDSVNATRSQIEELLSDTTKTEDAGWLLVRYIENDLNELCERLSAEIAYRYTRNDPPTMEELFDALSKRLKGKIKNHPAVQQLMEAKKYEPVLRNFVTHARSNAGSTISPQEIRRASEEWFKLEELLWCSTCNRFVEYNRQKDSVECKCGQKLCQNACVIETGSTIKQSNKQDALDGDGSGPAAT